MPDLLTIDPHTPTPEPVKYDKTDGQWYTHDGVDVKDTQQRKGNFQFFFSIFSDVFSVMPCNIFTLIKIKPL